MELDDFIKYAKEKFGCEVYVEKFENPDTFNKIFGDVAEDNMCKELESFDGGKPFLKPEKPFMLVYESEKDGMSIVWLETEEDMMETIEEIKSYGSTIVDAIEIGSYREFCVDES